MNFEALYAISETVGAAVALASFCGGVIYAILRVRFVTRGEHMQAIVRVKKVEGDVEGLATKLGQLVTKAEIGEIYARLGTVERQGAEMLGEMKGVHQQLLGTNNMLQLLVKNELEGGHKG
jgi:hypothetical protein